MDLSPTERFERFLTGLTVTVVACNVVLGGELVAGRFDALRTVVLPGGESFRIAVAHDSPWRALLILLLLTLSGYGLLVLVTLVRRDRRAETMWLVAGVGLLAAVNVFDNVGPAVR